MSFVSFVLCIKWAGLEHNVLLYVDDMLLYWSHPLSSLPKLMNLLTEFGLISGFKVNIQKSEVCCLQAQFLLKLALRNSSTLGFGLYTTIEIHIWPTINISYPMKQDIERWDHLPLSLGGLINMVKMKAQVFVYFSLSSIFF